MMQGKKTFQLNSLQSIPVIHKTAKAKSNLSLSDGRPVNLIFSCSTSSQSSKRISAPGSPIKRKPAPGVH
jgi:hypothetical protein